MQIIDVHKLRKTACNTSDWLIPSLDTEKEAVPSAAGVASGSGTSPTPNGAKKRKVLLSERCAYPEGVWDESPEDVLRSLTQCTLMCSSLVSVIASRLLTKSDALSTLQKNAARLWQAAAALQPVVKDDSNQRHVIVQVAQSVEYNGLALLKSSLLPRCSTNDQTAEQHTSSVVTALRSSVEGSPSISQMLWKVLVCAVSNFSSSEVTDAFDRFVGSTEVRICFCFRF